MKYVSFRSFLTDFDSPIFFLNHSYSFKHRIQSYLRNWIYTYLHLLSFIYKVFSQHDH